MQKSKNGSRLDLNLDLEGTEKEFIGQDTYLNFNSLQNIKKAKESRHRAKEAFLEDCVRGIITKDKVSSEMYQVYKIICQTDKLGGCSEADFEDPTTKAAIKAKLD